MTKLVYIGGFGRSGSTLLEYLLTTDPNVVGCGEVARHVRKFRTRKACTCGRPAPECPVWGSFQVGLKRANGLDHGAMTHALLEQVSAKYNAMVDSSKTAWGSSFMPFRLRRKLGSDFLLVHLVRDPRAVCWSTIKTLVKIKRGRRRISPSTRCLQTAVGWMAANLACEMFGALHPSSYLRVRYEDLVRSPDEVIKTILGRAGLKPAQRQPSSKDNRHQLYGNAVRFRPASLATIDEDAAWKSIMPKSYRGLAAIAWPLATKYGYFKATASG